MPGRVTGTVRMTRTRSWIVMRASCSCIFPNSKFNIFIIVFRNRYGPESARCCGHGNLKRQVTTLESSLPSIGAIHLPQHQMPRWRAHWSPDGSQSPSPRRHGDDGVSASTNHMVRGTQPVPRSTILIPHPAGTCHELEAILASKEKFYAFSGELKVVLGSVGCY